MSKVRELNVDTGNIVIKVRHECTVGLVNTSPI